MTSLRGVVRHMVRGCLLALVSLVLALRASAGPPFLTDDPEPVATRHWEGYLFSTMDATRPAKAGVMPALEFNYGAAPDLQLHVVVPWAFSSLPGVSRTSGLGDISLGVKLRFVHETDTRPQVGIFPMVSVPTGSSERNLGSGGSAVFLPIWVQKSFGPWTTYGGGGYTVSHAQGSRDTFSGGWLLQRELGEKVALGAEFFAQARSSDSTAGTTILDAGGQVSLAPSFSVLISAGGSVAGAHHRVAYLGLYWTWGPVESIQAKPGSGP
ncbi:MAG TPA: transporter [Thermoanaerobaculaceae bacterium]|nr:transporter [Thermoanaerobaculaceae bacterium]